MEDQLKSGEVFDKTRNVIVGNNRTAAVADRQEAKGLGFNSLLLSSMVEGEARHVGTAYVGIMKEILNSNNPVPKPAVVIAVGRNHRHRNWMWQGWAQSGTRA